MDQSGGATLDADGDGQSPLFNSLAGSGVLRGSTCTRGACASRRSPHAIRWSSRN